MGFFLGHYEGRMALKHASLLRLPSRRRFVEKGAFFWVSRLPSYRVFLGVGFFWVSRKQKLMFIVQSHEPDVLTFVTFAVY